MCDCGLKHIRMVPGGTFNTREEMILGCTEICQLNDMPWDGTAQAVPGGFDMCGCVYVTDYCPPN